MTLLIFFSLEYITNKMIVLQCINELKSPGNFKKDQLGEAQEAILSSDIWSKGASSFSISQLYHKLSR